MLDIQLIREQTEYVKNGLKLTGTDPSIIDDILDADSQRRALQTEGDELRSKMNAESKAIGKEKDSEKRQDLIKGMGDLKNKIKNASAKVPEIEKRFEQLMLSVPNIPLKEVPVGDGESGNIVKEIFGESPEFDFTPKPHWEIMENLGIIDFERGQKISGSRFYVLKGAGARLQRALITLMLDIHTEKHGYEELYPPVMVREECLYGTGNLPKFGENLYRDIEGEHWFVPTAEVPVTNFYRDEILPENALPIKHVAYTPCFRREKMSHGKDTRGIKRGHQFDKVEIVRFEHPDNSRAALEELTEDAREILTILGLKHRILTIGAGDLSFVSCMKYDLETWAAGTEEWLEVSSCSLFQDFQARRAKIRFKDSNGKNQFIHTLNGSGLALPRVVISIIESYQQKDGSVIIPEALRPYMGGLEKISPK